MWVAISLFSVDGLVMLLDASGYWEGLTKLVNANPFVAAVVHSPLLVLFLTGVILLTVYGERWLNLPRIKASYLGIKFIPRVGIGGLGLMDDIMRTAGNPDYELDIDLLVEVHLVNEADAAVTVKEFCGEVFIGAPSRWCSRIKPTMGCVRKKLNYLPYLDDYQIETRVPPSERPFKHIEANYRPLPSLTAQLEGVPLVRGHGYKGWLRFEAHMSRPEADNVKVKLWLIDALGVKHKVEVKNEGTVDRSATIVPVMPEQE
jgi:hypothetical protein